MFNSTNKSGSVQEDALMTVSTLAEVMGESFIKYIDAFKPFLLMGLKNITEHQVWGGVPCMCDENGTRWLV